MKWWPVMAVAMAACSYAEDEFREDYISEFCQWDAHCKVYYDDQESCEFALENNYSDLVAGCTYDAKSARRCIKGIFDVECPADGEDPAWPVECEDAYTDCPDPQ